MTILQIYFINNLLLVIEQNKKTVFISDTNMKKNNSNLTLLQINFLTENLLSLLFFQFHDNFH